MDVAALQVATTSATATAISAGAYHTCALMSNSTVRCWGGNSWGQLGDEAWHPIPTPVGGISDATAIATGTYHSCAVVTGGAVKCWGWNGHGQLGDGGTTSRSSPATVAGVSGAIALAAGMSHTCALLAVGTVTCWGYNDVGELGNGTRTSSLSPVPVSALTGVTAIDAGDYHTCARLGADGTVKCWGYNYQGQIGDGTTGDALTPVVPSGSDPSPQSRRAAATRAPSRPGVPRTVGG